ncbi:MAG: hypothetical protein FJY82_06890 [Candidatus Aminicenantes bacterium]|nr:hypothetical protein [Candidatus Aminicenantes bacterium]
MARSRIIRWAMAAVVIPIVFAGCAPSLVPSGFIFLGSREVNFGGVDRDSISIPPSRPEVRRLVVVAKMNPVEVFNIRVEFAAGGSFDAPSAVRLFPGRDRILIDLPGDARRVSQVVFRYRKLLNTARRAVVELWGR